MQTAKKVVRFKAAVLFAACFALLLSSALPQPASASPTSETPWLNDVYIDKVYKELSASQHYYWLYSCFKNVNIDNISRGEMTKWDFFEGSDTNAVLGTMYDKYDSDGVPGRRNCKSENVVQSAFGYLGYTNPREAFCIIEGANYKDDTNGGVNDCIAGAGGHSWDNDAKNNSTVANSFKDKFFSKKPDLNGSHYYMRAFSSFANGCDVKYPDKNSDGSTKLYDTDAVPGAGDANKYAVPVIREDGDGYVVKYVLGVGIDGDETNYIVANDKEASSIGDRAISKSCDALVAEMKEHAGAYLTVRGTPGTVGGSEQNDAGGATSGDETTCGIDGVGWIVCPLATFMATLNDNAFTFLTKLLTINPALITSESTRTAWEKFRDLANIAFIVAFMVIIYSQITGAGVSNYGLKKLLPRIFVAAILVNLSYILCALAVDLSNIVGSSIYSFLGGIVEAESGAGSGVSDGWQTFTEVALAAAGIAMLVIMLPALPLVLLAVALILFILIARQALVILLVVAAPLAFVAYLLPNTETWFKKWRQAFTTVLMVFPIVAAIFGASTMASTIIMNIAESGESDDQELLKLVALIVLAVPLFAVPLALKGSMAAAGAVGARLSGIADRTGKRASNRATGSVKEKYGNSAFARGRSIRKHAKDQFNTTRFAEGVSGQDTSLAGRFRRRTAGGVLGGRSFTAGGEYAQDHLSSSALSQAVNAKDKEYEEAVRAAGTQQAGFTNAEVARISATGRMADGRDASEHELAAANDRIMKTGSFNERREALEHLASTKGTSAANTKSLRNRAVQGAYSRGDQNIYGVDFGNQLASETGTIDGEQALAQAAQDNASKGKVSADHLLQSAGASDYVTKAADGTLTRKDENGNTVKVLSSGNATAVDRLKASADTARTGEQTKTKVTTEIDAIFKRVGSS